MWTWKQRWFQDISELSKAACTLRNTGSSIKNHVLFGICWLGCSTEGKAAHTHGCSCSSCLGDYFTGAGRPSGCWRCGPGWPKFSSTASCHKPFIETLAAPPWFSQGQICAEHSWTPFPCHTSFIPDFFTICKKILSGIAGIRGYKCNLS